MTGINRRHFICASAAGLAAAALAGNGLAGNGSAGNGLASNRVASSGLASALNNSEPQAQFLSASSNNQGQHFIGAWSTDGKPRFQIPVPHRAHDSCCSDDGKQAVFFARRPGIECYIVDLVSGRLQHTIKAQAGTHFYGHGVFSSTGRFLYTTENAYRRSDPKHSGVIGVYDTKNFQRLGEFSSQGIGPHQLALLSDGHTLAVANGGILTHPERGREKLNLDTMQSSLAYIDTRDGKPVDQFYPQHPQMSIRHLSVGAGDQLALGIQFQGPRNINVPLVLSHAGQQQLQPMSAEQSQWSAMEHYIASIAVDHSATLAVSTSPRGATVALWDLANRHCLATIPVRDVAGVAYLKTERQFLLSNGLGQVLTLAASREALLATPRFSRRAVQWDNHLSLI